MNRQTILSTLTHPAVKWGLGAALVLLLALLPLLAIEIPGILPGPSYTPGSLQLRVSIWSVGGHGRETWV